MKLKTLLLGALLSLCLFTPNINAQTLIPSDREVVIAYLIDIDLARQLTDEQIVFTNSLAASPATAPLPTKDGIKMLSLLEESLERLLGAGIFLDDARNVENLTVELFKMARATKGIGYPINIRASLMRILLEGLLINLSRYASVIDQIAPSAAENDVVSISDYDLDEYDDHLRVAIHKCQTILRALHAGRRVSESILAAFNKTISDLEKYAHFLANEQRPIAEKSLLELQERCWRRYEFAWKKLITPFPKSATALASTPDMHFQMTWQLPFAASLNLGLLSSVRGGNVASKGNPNLAAAVEQLAHNYNTIDLNRHRVTSIALPQIEIFRPLVTTGF